MQVEFVFFAGCPNAGVARDRLRTALTRAGRAPEWTEWDTTDAATPSRVRGFASPTVLVNGEDVERKAPTSGAGCAVGGGPSVDQLLNALARQACER